MIDLDPADPGRPLRTARPRRSLAVVAVARFGSWLRVRCRRTRARAMVTAPARHHEESLGRPRADVATAAPGPWHPGSARLRAGRLLAGILIATLAACAAPARAPRPDPSAPGVAGSGDALLPVDPAVRTGRLGNGLTWYVRPHPEPRRRAELRLAVDAGSLQEDDDQRGLAHFVEHMAFNGTRSFARNDLVDFLELLGMRFGPDINASTGFDETVYSLTLPTDDPEILARGLDVLAEWAGAVSFDGEEIERERGVLLEEWREGRGAAARIADRQLPVIFEGSRYAERLPIGTREAIEGAPQDAVRRYYRDWYRPDLMAVVAVGDFDPGEVESLIRSRFAGLAGPSSPRRRESAPVPDHEGTRVTIATDPEATSTGIRIYAKLPGRPAGTGAGYRQRLVESLYHDMINARLDEITQEPDPPFLFAFSTSGSLVRSREIVLQAAGVAPGGLERGLEALLTEVERVDRHGFTEGELDRARKDILRGYEQAFRERDTIDASALADEILRHYLEDEPMPGIEAELSMVVSLLRGITLDEVNSAAAEWIGEDNRVIAIGAPETAAGPPTTQERVLALFDRVRHAPLDPWVDKVVDAPLLAELPAPGGVVEETALSAVGASLWQLSNGVRVILKPTDFRNDEILLSGYSPGGHSLASDEEYASALFADAIVDVSGVGAFGATELDKALAGVFAGATVSIGELEEEAGGSASPEDLETMLQLLYLHVTQPRFDAEAFGSLVSRLEGLVENRLARPETLFADRMSEALSQGHPRRRPLSADLIGEIDLRTAERIYRDRFSDAGDFTFTIVGSFDPGTVRPLVERYLGGLPAAGRRESWRDVGVRPPGGVVRVDVSAGKEPKSQVSLVFTNEAAWSRQALHDLDSLASLLRLRLREALREEMGSTYGVSVSGSLSRRPVGIASLSIGFGCSPESVDDLVGRVFGEIERVKREGASEVEVAKIREAQRRQREVSLRENGFWLSILEAYDRYGDDPALILAYDELVGSVTSDRLREAASLRLDTGRYVLGVLRPEGGP